MALKTAEIKFQCLYIKFYWDIATPVQLCVGRGHSDPGRRCESLDRDHMAHKA